jgi:hypothetical protein
MASIPANNHVANNRKFPFIITSNFDSKQNSVESTFGAMTPVFPEDVPGHGKKNGGAQASNRRMRAPRACSR